MLGWPRGDRQPQRWVRNIHNGTHITIRRGRRDHAPEPQRPTELPGAMLPVRDPCSTAFAVMLERIPDLRRVLRHAPQYTHYSRNRRWAWYEPPAGAHLGQHDTEGRQSSCGASRVGHEDGKLLLIRHILGPAGIVIRSVNIPRTTTISPLKVSPPGRLL